MCQFPISAHPTDPSQTPRIRLIYLHIPHINTCDTTTHHNAPAMRITQPAGKAIYTRPFLLAGEGFRIGPSTRGRFGSSQYSSSQLRTDSFRVRAPLNTNNFSCPNSREIHMEATLTEPAILSGTTLIVPRLSKLRWFGAVFTTQRPYSDTNFFNSR